MDTQTFIDSVYLKATGKKKTLTSADTPYAKILAIGNRLIRQWAQEPDVDWNSLYNPSLALTATVTATNTFPLAAASTIRKISDARGDFVRIHWTDGINFTDFQVVPADTLKRYSTSANVCAQVGSSLQFARTFVSTDSEYGGTIKVPVYLYPDTLVASDPGSGESTTVPVDDPEWLVIMSAAEYVRNDITKQNQYPNLVAEGNQYMQRMIDDNNAQVNEVYIPPGVARGRTW